jgi:hypothetical protein
MSVLYRSRVSLSSVITNFHFGEGIMTSLDLHFACSLLVPYLKKGHQNGSLLNPASETRQVILINDYAQNDEFQLHDDG